LFCHDSILSRNGVSGNPGAVHFRLKTIPSLIPAGVKVILPSGWEKEDAMDAIGYCEGEETRCCEGGVCFLAPEDKAEPEDVRPFGYDYEEFGEL